MALEQELATFESMKAELLKNYEGKFALIRGEEFLGAFDNPENAYQEGIKKLGRASFLVKRISESEEVYRNQALASGLICARLDFFHWTEESGGLLQLDGPVLQLKSACLPS